VLRPPLEKKVVSSVITDTEISLKTEMHRQVARGRSTA